MASGESNRYIIKSTTYFMSQVMTTVMLVNFPVQQFQFIEAQREGNIYKIWKYLIYLYHAGVVPAKRNQYQGDEYLLV